jgi:hypothetical protein
MIVKSLAAFALMAALAFGFPHSKALAGTTGALSGLVTDQRNAPVAGAKVTVSSPAQQEETTTDARGQFTFVSLFPDAYTVTVSKQYYGRQQVGTVAVNADAATSIVLRVARLFWVIDGLQSRMKTALVQPGQAADRYVILPSWPLYDINGTSIYALHFIPGLSFGAGPPAAP